MRRLLLAAAAGLGALFLSLVVAIFGVLAFAGPHSDLLPRPWQLLVYGLAIASVLVLPALAVRAAWRRAAP